tara:strand:- start:33 stop:320 length:288 start_codon:yes stop_codon:yes gene_type:complete
MVYLKHNTTTVIHTKGNNMTNQKRFDVKAIDPVTGRPTTFRSVSRDQLRQNDSGETVFRYNDYHDSCEVISVVEVPQAKLDAERRYFEKYGTANE